MSPTTWSIYHGADCMHAECKAETRRLRASERGARPQIPPAVREAVIRRDGLICRLCGCAVVRRSWREPYRPDTLHLDHVEFYADVRAHEIDNLRVVCAACNLSRPKPKRARP